MNLLFPIFIIGALIIANVNIKPTENPNATRTHTSTPIKTVEPTKTTEETNVVIEITYTPDKSLTIGNIIYPDSNPVGENTYESTDNPDTITDWYKSIIEGKNMNITSFVTTNTNGNIKNTITAVSESKKLDIEIIKNTEDSKTIIKVR